MYPDDFDAEINCEELREDDYMIFPEDLEDDNPTEQDYDPYPDWELHEAQFSTEYDEEEDW
jgi:hypothetical protein